MYAAGTGGLASSGGVIRRLTGTSFRCQQSRSHATTVAMTRPTGDRRFTCGMGQGRKAMAVGASATGPARGGPSPSPVSPRPRSGGSLATPLLRNEEVILHPLQLLHRRIAIVRQCSSWRLPIFLPASLVDAFGDCLFRSAPEASHHQRRHDGNAGHNDPVRNGRDSDRERRKAHRNRPGNEQQCLGHFRRT